MQITADAFYLNGLLCNGEFVSRLSADTRVQEKMVCKLGRLRKLTHYFLWLAFAPESSAPVVHAARGFIHNINRTVSRTSPEKEFICIGTSGGHPEMMTTTPAGSYSTVFFLSHSHSFAFLKDIDQDTDRALRGCKRGPVNKRVRG